MGPKPESERQARPLAKLPADQQPAAWERAQGSTAGGTGWEQWEQLVPTPQAELRHGGADTRR